MIAGDAGKLVLFFFKLVTCTPANKTYFENQVT